VKHRCRHFEQYSATRPSFRDVIPSKRFCLNGFRRAFLTTTLGYGRIIVSQTCSKLRNDGIKDSEVALGKILLTL